MRCTKNSFCNFWKRAKTWRATSILHGCCNPRDREKAGQEVKVGVSIFGYIMTFLEFRAINACCSWGEQSLYHQQSPEKNNANCGYSRFPILIMSPPDSDWRIILEWLGSHSTRRCRDSSLHVSSFYKKKIFSSPLESFLYKLFLPQFSKNATNYFDSLPKMSGPDTFSFSELEAPVRNIEIEI